MWVFLEIQAWYIYTCRMSLVTQTGHFFFWVTFFTQVGGKQSPYLEGWYKFCTLSVSFKVSVLGILTWPGALLNTCFIDHRSHWWARCFRAQALELLISSENALLTSWPQRSCWFYISWLTVCYKQISPLNLICTSYSLFILSDSWILCWVSALYFLISATSAVPRKRPIKLLSGDGERPTVTCPLG